MLARRDTDEDKCHALALGRPGMRQCASFRGSCLLSPTVQVWFRDGESHACSALFLSSHAIRVLEMEASAAEMTAD